MSTDHNVLIGNNSDTEINITKKSSYEYSSNFKCINNVYDENIDFVFENAIKAHNMSNNVINVPEFVPRIKQLKNTQTGQCSCLGKCRFQITNGSHAGDYGFIPLQPLGRFTDNPNPNHIGDNSYISLHNRLSDRKNPNCSGPQIRIKTDLNIPLWEELLKGDRDHQLIYFLKYGFPLDMPYSPAFEPNVTVSNHSTAKQFPASIQDYLKTEISHRAIMGPYSKPPLVGLHCSPMLTRPKTGSDSRRVIVDLSWPHGNSVNDVVSQDTYMGTPFKLKFPSVDDITARIRDLDGKCLLYKIDLQRAFRHLKLDPGDINRTGLQFEGRYYVDTSVPFGYRHGSVCMQRLTDSIRGIMHKKGYFIANYIDDLIGCDPPKLAWEGFKFLKQLIGDLGLVISQGKLFQPQNCIPCLGIKVNVATGIISIPDEKLEQIIGKCSSFAGTKYTDKKSLQSLIGSLLYVHKCVRPARLFVNRILSTLREAPATGRIELSQAFHSDVAWFNAFLPKFNGKVYFNKASKPPITNLYVDACLTGMGGALGSSVYALAVTSIPHLPSPCTIVHLEMVNVFIALNIWRQALSGKSVVIHCDNMAVVSSLSSGRSWDSFLATVARNVWLITATYDIELVVNHIPGKDNGLADSLSRWYGGTLRQDTITQLLSYQWSPVTSPMLELDLNI